MFKTFNKMNIKNCRQFHFNITMLIALTFVAINGCKDDNNTAPVNETSTVTDIEGNVYQTVKIGNQWWMAQDLKVKKYRNGNLIRNAQSLTDWPDTIPAYCLYDNNPSAPGLLYNFYAVQDTGNIAPAGWHIPSDAEWKTLEITLGMSQTEADKLTWRGTNQADQLKVASPNGWTRFGDVWSSNSSGFSALAGGCRLFNGVFADPGLFATGFWWTSTSYADNEGFYRYLDYKNSDVFRSHVVKNYGMAIRCVKD